MLDQEPIQSNSTSFHRHHTEKEHKNSRQYKVKGHKQKANWSALSFCHVVAHILFILHALLFSLSLGVRRWLRLIIITLPGLFELSQGFYAYRNNTKESIVKKFSNSFIFYILIEFIYQMNMQNDNFQKLPLLICRQIYFSCSILL